MQRDNSVETLERHKVQQRCASSEGLRFTARPFAVSRAGKRPGRRMPSRVNNHDPTVSGRVPLVPVMEAAHLRESNDASEFWRLHHSRLRRVLSQRKMCLDP
jgi:hypothetical protein